MVDYNMAEYGALVISLDFEMMWGNLERWTIDGYGKTNVCNVRLVIDRMLSLFDKYQVHATFATVGLLMHVNKAEAIEFQPGIKPTYNNSRLSPYANHHIESIKDNNQKLYFAPEVVRILQDTNGIEIATHTYCHYFCWENGQTKEQFEADIKKAVEVAEKKGVSLKSIVFPRNNVSEDYLDICVKYGITSYRGNPQKYFENKTGLARKWMRVGRILDYYLDLGNKTSYKAPELRNGILNIPASRMLRPYSKKFRLLEPLRIRRIKNELKYAAKHNEIYHIWWHPHNFGANMDKNMAILEEVLKSYSDCQKKYGMTSLTMNEVYNEYCKNGE